MSFNSITEFENKIADFFGAKYAVAVDCATHGVELCLRHEKIKKISVPKRTYISIPFLAEKLGIELEWRDDNWEDYYPLNYDNKRIIDAAVLWRKDSYTPGTLMSVTRRTMERPRHQFNRLSLLYDTRNRRVRT